MSDADAGPFTGEFGEVCTVLVPLVGGGPEAFRMTTGVQLGYEVFRLLGPVPPGEQWRFQPGEVVCCIIKVLSSTEAHWLAHQLSEEWPG